MLFQSYLSLVSGEVTIFSQQHIAPVIICMTLGSLLIFYAKRSLNLEKQKQIFSYLGWFVSGALMFYHIQLLFSGNYDCRIDLPLFLCSFIALFIPLFTSTRKYWLFEILVFWIIAGTTQGIITPDVAGVFPELEYFRYWIVHLGLYTIIFYAILVFNMRPKFSSVFKAAAGIQFYMILMAFVNYFLDANYSYLSRKPSSVSVLDYFGDWPNYIVVVELLIIPYFLLIYFFFFLAGRTKVATHKRVITDIVK